MPREKITVVTGGEVYRAWRDVTVEYGGGQAARQAWLTIKNPDAVYGDDWPFHPGAEVALYATGDLLLKGFVDDYQPSFDLSCGHPQSWAAVTIRSKSKDPVDSSAIHKTGEWLDKKPDEISKDLLKPFGLNFENALGDLPKIPVHRLAPGATVFDELSHIWRQHRALLIGMPDGGIKATRADKFKAHDGPLVEGVNLQKASANLSEKDRHSKVHARGQKNRGSGASAQRIEHVAQDQTIARYRPLMILVEGDTDAQRVKDRGEWQVARSAGWSKTASLDVFGWRDRSGALWDPEKMVFVDSRRLKLQQFMALKTIQLRQSKDEGTVATLSCVDPKALGGKDGKSGSNDAWKT